MPVRVGLISVAHVHAPGFLHAFREHPEVEIAGVWDHDSARQKHFCEKRHAPGFESLDQLLDSCDAVVVSSENNLHLEHCAAAAARGKSILCEKPVVASRADAEKMRQAIPPGVRFTTAFPCRFAPSFLRFKERFQNGEIGAVKGICATNRGSNPFGWFVVPEFSGGGAIIDHTVHVADLLWLLLGREPSCVQATVGFNQFEADVEDTAILTLDYDDGLFGTLDASWSRPKSYRTWGDVTITLVGEEGVMELDLFAQQLQVYSSGETTHTVHDFGADINQALVNAFVQSILDDGPSPVSLEDGLRASEVAFKAYERCHPSVPARTLAGRPS